jgi:hypothetical protein
MRSITAVLMLGSFLGLGFGTAHAGGAKAAQSDETSALSALVKSWSTQFGVERTYRMPSGSTVSTAVFRHGTIAVEGKTRRVTNRPLNDQLPVREIANKVDGTVERRSMTRPPSKARFISRENLRTQRGTWLNDVEMVTYRDGEGQEKRLILTPGDTQVEHHGGTVDEEAIVHKVQARHVRQMELDKAFGATPAK